MNNNDFFNSQNAPVIKDSRYYRSRGRAVLKGFWGISVLVCVLASIISGGIADIFSPNITVYVNPELVETAEGMTEAELQQKIEADIEPLIESGDFDGLLRYFFPDYEKLLTVAGGFVAIALLINLVLGAAMSYGQAKFFLELRDKHAEGISVGTLFDGFKKIGVLGKAIAVNVLVVLLAALGTAVPVLISVGLAIVIPDSLAAISILLGFLCDVAAAVIAIVIAMRYSMVFFVLADHNDIGIIAVLKESGAMMKGNKMRLFVLVLSFIGWLLLSVFCCCGVGLLWVEPYIQATLAEFYHDISGRIAATEAETAENDTNTYGF